MSQESGNMPPSSGPVSDDAVDRLVDGLVAGAGLSIDDPLAEAAWQIRALATEPLPPATRERHLARIRQALAPPLPRRRFVAFRRRVAVLATSVTAALTLTGGVTYAAAQQALPGDGLYGLKRATERLALAIEQDPAEDAKLLVRFAQRRLHEAAARPAHADELVADAIDQLQLAAEVPGVAGSQSVEVIRDVLLQRLPILQGLPGPASGQARHALALVCLELATQRGEEIPAVCVREAQAPPEPNPASPDDGVQQAGEPAGGPPPADPPPPGAQPAAEPPPPGPPPPDGPPPPPPPAEPPPPTSDETEGQPDVDDRFMTEPPPPDSGGRPPGRGRGRAEKQHRAPDDVGGPSAVRTDRGGWGRRGRGRS